MDAIITLLIILLIIMAFATLSYVMYHRMRGYVERRHAGWYINHDPRFWVKRWRKECPRGCQFVGRNSGNAMKKGGKWGCPNGEFCYGEHCCKYDNECNKC